MSEFLKDFKPGPLDFYRRKASFDWKQLKCFLETEEIVKYEQVHCTQFIFIEKLVLYSSRPN